MSYLDSQVSYINKQCKFGGILSNLNDRLKNKERLLQSSKELNVEPYITFNKKGESIGYKMTISKCFCKECLDKKKMTQFLSAFADETVVNKLYNRMNDKSTITIDTDQDNAKIYFIPKEENQMRKLKNQTGEYIFKLPSFKSIDKTEDIRIIRITNSKQLKKYLNVWFGKTASATKEKVVDLLAEMVGDFWCKRSVLITRKGKTPYMITFKFLCNCGDIMDEESKGGDINFPLNKIKDNCIELSKLTGLKSSKVKTFFENNADDRLSYLSFNNNLDKFELRINHSNESEKVKDSSNFIFDKAYTNLLFPYKTSNLKLESKNHSNLLVKTFNLFSVSDKYKEITDKIINYRSGFNNVWEVNNSKGGLSYKFHIYPDVHTFQKDVYNILHMLSSIVNVKKDLVNIDEGYDRFTISLGDEINSLELTRNRSSSMGFSRAWDGKNINVFENFNIYYSKNVKGNNNHYTEIPTFLKENKIENNQEEIFKYGMPKFSIRLAQRGNKKFNIQYCGLKVDTFIKFLKDFKYPKTLISYMKKEKDNYSHLYFDVGYDFKVEKRKLTEGDSSFYGWI
jgi:hypothetical protein